MIPSVRRHVSSSRGNLLAAFSAFIFLLSLITIATTLRFCETEPLLIAALSPISLPPIAILAIHLSRLFLHYFLRPIDDNYDDCVDIEDLIVVVPVIVRGTQDVEAIKQCTEANLSMIARHPLVFLLDFSDADSKLNERDSTLMALVNSKISTQLAASQVIILTRERRYDPIDRIWRGWERKRGKLEEFCQLLHGDKNTSFIEDVPHALHNTYAIVTIDIDTRLEPHTIARLSCALDRNAAIVTPMLRDVCGPDPSYFERMQQAASRRMSTNPSMNFNQSRLGYDLFYGKGLIIVDRFLHRMRGRIAERTILSHDHLEAMMVGAVASSTASVTEYVPRSREQWVRRQLRWTRGDFQVTPWILRSDLPIPARLHLLEIVLNHITPSCCFGISVIILFSKEGLMAKGLALFVALCAHPALVLLPLSCPLFFIGNSLQSVFRWQLLRQAALTEISAWFMNFAYAPGNALMILRAAIVVTYRRVWSGRNLLEWEDSGRVQPSTMHPYRHGISLGFVIFIYATVQHSELSLVLFLFFAWTALPRLLRIRATANLGRDSIEECSNDLRR